LEERTSDAARDGGGIQLEVMHVEEVRKLGG
jgi:hypothetical protein